MTRRKIIYPSAGCSAQTDNPSSAFGGAPDSPPHDANVPPVSAPPFSHPCRARRPLFVCVWLKSDCSQCYDEMRGASSFPEHLGLHKMVEIEATFDHPRESSAPTPGAGWDPPLGRDPLPRGGSAPPLWSMGWGVGARSPSTNAKKVTVSVLYWYEKTSSLRLIFLE